MTDQWIKIGIVGKAHGLYGAFFLSGRDSELDDSVSDLRVGEKPGQGKSLRIKSRKSHNGRTIIQTQEISGRDQLDEIKGKIVWCPRDQIAVDEQEYLWDDLIGKSVIDANDQPMGVIERMNNYGASDIVELLDGRGRLSIPFVPSYFDMNFDADSNELRLVVSADVFDESWEEA